MKYQIVVAYSVRDMEELVQVRMDEGWELVGSLSIEPYEHGARLFQAMVNHYDPMDYE